MQKIFKADSKKDLGLSEIEFKDNHFGEFILEIRCKTSKESAGLKAKMLGFQRLYEMDSATNQEFTLEHDESKNLVRVTGNIDNALKIMSERGLISKELYEEITSNSDVKNFIQSSSAIVSTYRSNPIAYKV